MFARFALARTRWIAIAIATLLLTIAAPSIARADVIDDGDPTARSSEGEGTPWGTIVAGCLGVLFGGAIAAWQIRGLSRRGND